MSEMEMGRDDEDVRDGGDGREGNLDFYTMSMSLDAHPGTYDGFLNAFVCCDTLP